MSVNNLLTKTLFIILLPFYLCAGGNIEYTWKIEGAIEPHLLERIKTDDTLASKEHAIASLNALCQLAENQVELWLELLHSCAYFDATVDWTLDQDSKPIVVTFQIDAGCLYPLAVVDIVWRDPRPFYIGAEDLGLKIGDPALPSSILAGEEEFLLLMALRGYPLAKICEREVLVDQAAHSTHLILHVEGGQQVRFGSTKIEGSATVDPDYIWQKIAWKEGKVFNPEKIERTQEELEATGLFSSVVIKEGMEPDADGRIPLNVYLTEAKHRTVASGIGYSTQQGPGLSAEWQHRNFRGKGERLDIRANAWTAVQTGLVEYMIPSFHHSNQDLRFLLEAEHEKTKGYTETSFSISSFLDKRINDWTFLSYGTSYKQLRTENSDNNGVFNLLKFPVTLKWTSANDLLDPTKGMSFNIKSTPSFQIGSHTFGYWTNTAVGSFYLPLDDAESWVFASKLTIGTILGASRREIPPSERFYSGTENTLRGYRFMSVSPLDDRRKPIGGRSMLISSNEIRWKCSEKIGLAAFYEAGNVYADPFPDVSKGVLQSAGAGLRYSTPVGPIRFDVAVPLNRRPHVDPACQFYMSIGQAF